MPATAQPIAAALAIAQDEPDALNIDDFESRTIVCARLISGMSGL